MVKRVHRSTTDGKYHHQGKSFKEWVGSRRKVFHGTAYQTRGNLTKSDLVKNKHGEIVSRKKHLEGIRYNRLLAHGYGTRKGKFGYVKVRPHSSVTRKYRKHRYSLRKRK